jgi:hypothetical protein
MHIGMAFVMVRRARTVYSLVLYSFDRLLFVSSFPSEDFSLSLFQTHLVACELKSWHLL